LAAFPLALALPFLEFLHEFSAGFIAIQAHPHQPMVMIAPASAGYFSQFLLCHLFNRVTTASSSSPGFPDATDSPAAKSSALSPSSASHNGKTPASIPCYKSRRESPCPNGRKTCTPRSAGGVFFYMT
jgi:hypothetical protein